jgi:hypothetical protein
MPEVSRTYFHPKDVDVSISQIVDGIYRISGFVESYGITFNQFLIDVFLAQKCIQLIND